MSSHESAGRLTRRGFLGTGGIAVVASQSVVPALLAPDLAVAGQAAAHDAGYLEAVQQYLEWTEKLARGVIESGVPEKLTPGYWNVACQCCGAAAEVDFFLSLWVATGKRSYREFACRVADQLISRSTDLDGKGYRWYQAWTRVKPWEVNAETGYKIGASGIGATLVHTQLAIDNRYSAILFPDNPFPRTQRT